MQRIAEAIRKELDWREILLCTTVDANRSPTLVWARPDNPKMREYIAGIAAQAVIDALERGEYQDRDGSWHACTMDRWRHNR